MPKGGAATLYLATETASDFFNSLFRKRTLVRQSVPPRGPQLRALGSAAGGYTIGPSISGQYLMSRFCWRPSCFVLRLSCRHWELLFWFAARQSTLPARASCLAAWFTFLPCWRCCDWLVAKAVPGTARRPAAASIAPVRHQNPLLDSTIFMHLRTWLKRRLAVAPSRLRMFVDSPIRGRLLR